MREIFSRSGAYARFKDLFEAKAQEEALREWCEANGIDLAEGTEAAGNGGGTQRHSGLRRSRT